MLSVDVRVFKRRMIHSAYIQMTRSGFNDFVAFSKDPFTIQKKKLFSLISANQNTNYAKQYNFSSIKSIEDFQNQVPIIDYEKISSFIENIAMGQQNILTSAPVKIFEHTSGSSSRNKLIPYTAKLLEEFSAATTPWMHDLFFNLKKLRGTSSYLSISPMVRLQNYTSGGIKIGFEDDSEYLGSLQRWAWKVLNSVPADLAKESDFGRWEYMTAKYLLADESLGLISVWSPTFAIRLIQIIEKHFNDIVKELPRRRANELTKGLSREGRFNSRALWPKLSLLSCWADGPSENFLKELENLYPDILIQPKGLLATEGVVSFPLLNQLGSVAAINSHFLEFLSVDDPDARPLLVNQLVKEGLYSPILTTGGGLYRYHLKDVVKVVGFYNKTPLLRFEHKYDRIGDLVGEKLNAYVVQQALLEACAEFSMTPRFAMLAPVLSTPPNYFLFIETDRSAEDCQKVVEFLENRLLMTHHYSLARKMNQLSSVKYLKIRDGTALYEKRLVELGQRRGNIKPTALDTRTDWMQTFHSESKQ